MLSLRTFNGFRCIGKYLVLAAAISCAAESEPEYFDGDRVGHLAFSPMFSAYDGVHEYAVTPSVPGAEDDPAEGNPVLASSIRWEVDSAFVSRSDFPDLPNAIKLTTKKPGKTTVTMIARHLVGPTFRQQAALTILRASAVEWEIGNERYVRGPVVPFPDELVEPDAETCELSDSLSATTQAACVSCHADAERSGSSVDVTPTQIAGYSDSDLLEIITAAAKPAGGTYNSACLSKSRDPDREFQALHRFDLNDEEKQGIVVKLRSLTPRVAEWR